MQQLRRLVAGFPPRQPEFEPVLCHAGFMVDEVAVGQAFSECLDFPANLHSTNCSTIIIIYHHLGLVK
jgi:hypothetical protein